MAKKKFFLIVERGCGYKFGVNASNNKKATMSLSKQRISDVDITVLECSVVFRGKTHKLDVYQTCYGDFLVNITHFVMLSSGSEEKPAYNHFNKISKRCPALNHGKELLKENIEVRPNASFINLM